MAIAHRAYIINNGHIVYDGTVADLKSSAGHHDALSRRSEAESQRLLRGDGHARQMDTRSSAGAVGRRTLKAAPPSGARFDPDRASEAGDDHAANRQPQAAAFGLVGQWYRPPGGNARTRSRASRDGCPVHCRRQPTRPSRRSDME